MVDASSSQLVNVVPKVAELRCHLLKESVIASRAATDNCRVQLSAN